MPASREAVVRKSARCSGRAARPLAEVLKDAGDGSSARSSVRSWISSPATGGIGIVTVALIAAYRLTDYARAPWRCRSPSIMATRTEQIAWVVKIAGLTVSVSGVFIGRSVGGEMGAAALARDGKHPDDDLEFRLRLAGNDSHADASRTRTRQRLRQPRDCRRRALYSSRTSLASRARSTPQPNTRSSRHCSRWPASGGGFLRLRVAAPRAIHSSSSTRRRSAFRVCCCSSGCGSHRGRHVDLLTPDARADAGGNARAGGS